MPAATENSKMAAAPPTSKEPAPESFRYYLRQADKVIKEGQFQKAKQLLEEAKKIDPANPFIVAFEERIRLFEAQISSPDQPQKPTPKQAKVAAAAVHVDTEKQDDHVDADRQVLEQRLRQKIEAEYKAKFTQELRNAEERARLTIEDERSKLDQQQRAFKAKHDAEVGASQRRLEEEYRKKLEEEVSRADQRLQKRLQEKLSLAEGELKGQLSLTYEEEQLQLQAKIKCEQEEVLEKERRTFQEKEKQIKEQYDRQLLEALRKTENVIRAQSVQQQEFEKEQLRKKLAVEFQAELHSEREAIKSQYDGMKQQIEQSFQTEQQRLKDEMRHQMEEQLTLLKRREAENFEHQRVVLRQEFETELQQKQKQQLESERERMKRETDEVIEAEKKHTQMEYNAQFEEQGHRIRKVRTELQKEMEANFIKRMQQLSEEYDHKMELLGTKMPETVEEKHALYRTRMRQCYLRGEPTVEEAKRIMELKEMLELSFDEHLAIETDVRLDLYVENVERTITAGETNLKEPSMISQFKEQFRISAEEYARLEPYIVSCIQRAAVKGRILVVDDDLLLLQTLEDILSGAGYQVVPTEGVTQAMDYLKETPVDLILSDIKFGESDLDGFQFYAAVQAEPHLHKLPFLLMSSLRDGVIIRSGVQLGVDDYLTKPLDPDLLMAVIEGKLKRFRKLDQR